MLLADLHSSIGLIREIHGNTRAAIDSYIKALWILHRRQPRQPSSLLETDHHDHDHNDNGDDALVLGSAAAATANLNQMAVIMYRMANAHGRMGNYDQMQELMQLAQSFYNQSSLEQRLYNSCF
jgi:hypothetical protein